MCTQPPLIAVVPSPGMGHLIPLLEFSKLLFTRFHFSISLIIPIATQPTKEQISVLDSLPSGISYTILPPQNPSLLPSDVAPEVTITATLSHSLPSIRSALASLNPTALVTDLFGTELFSIARELCIPPYLYFTSTVMCLQLFFTLPTLDETVSCEYKDMAEPLVMPGCVPLHGRDFVLPTQDRKGEPYRVLLDHAKKYSLVEGIFINTFLDAEPGAINGFKTNPTRPPLYPIGPLVRGGSGGDSKSSECLKWLDQQPVRSVIYVSFGSGGTFSSEQLKELAIGLEASDQRFLWVVRKPSDHSSHASYFGSQNEDDPLGFLPKEYVARIKDRAMLIPSWAPQTEILSHRSIGGFVTHCGWNSILESIVNGVPLIAWPLYAEQRMNAVMLNEGLTVALRPKVNEHGLVEANELASVVKNLMEGQKGAEVRAQMTELSKLAKKSVGEGGNSTRLLSEVALRWSQCKKEL